MGISFRNFFECTKAEAVCQALCERLATSQNDELVRHCQALILSFDHLSLAESSLNIPESLLEICETTFSRLKVLGTRSASAWVLKKIAASCCIQSALSSAGEIQQKGDVSDQAITHNNSQTRGTTAGQSKTRSLRAPQQNH